MTREHLPSIDIFILKVDVRGMGEVEEIGQAILTALKEKGLNPDKLMFSGINGAREKFFLEHGIDVHKDEKIKDEETLYCTPAQNLLRQYDEYGDRVDDNPILYAENFNKQAVAVYDAGKLQNSMMFGGPMENEYEPVEGGSYRDALVAIIHLQN